MCYSRYHIPRRAGPYGRAAGGEVNPEAGHSLSFPFVGIDLFGETIRRPRLMPNFIPG